MKRKNKNKLYSALLSTMIIATPFIISKPLTTQAKESNVQEDSISTYNSTDNIDTPESYTSSWIQGTGKAGASYTGNITNNNIGDDYVIQLNHSWCYTKANEVCTNVSGQTTAESQPEYDYYHEWVGWGNVDGAMRVEAEFYQLPSSSAFYGYYGVMLSAHNWTWDWGVGNTSANIYDTTVSISSSSGAQYYYLHDINDYYDSGGSNTADSYITTYLIMAPGTYTISYEVLGTRASLTGSVSFNQDGNTVTNSTFTLPQYANINDGTWDLTESQIESWMPQTPTYENVTSLESIINGTGNNGLNNNIYQSFSNNYVGTNTNPISKDDLIISYVDYTTGETLLTGDANDKTTSVKAKDDYKITVSYDGAFKTFDDIDTWLYVYTPTVSNITESSVDVSVNVTDESKVNTIHYSIDNGQSWISAPKDQNNDNVLNFTISNLEANKTYSDIQIKINLSEETIYIPSFNTIAFGDTNGMIATNTTSVDGTSTLVKVNYANLVENQNITYSIDNGQTWLNANIIDNVDSYDSFLIEGLTPNTHYDLQIKNSGTLISGQTYDIITLTAQAITGSTITPTSTGAYVQLHVSTGLYSAFDQLNFYYRIDAMNEYILITDEDTTNNTIDFTITGLQPQTDHQLDFAVENKNINNENTQDRVLQVYSTTFTTLSDGGIGITEGKTVTNTVSTDGTSATVRVNYINSVSSQNIQYSTNGGSTWTNATITDSNLYYDEFTITGLTPNSYYDLRIKISGSEINTNINDIYTLTSSLVTYAYIDPNQITTNSAYIQLSTQPTMYGHTNEVNYYYSLNNGELVLIEDEFLGDISVQFHINNLMPYTTYNISFFVEDKNTNNQNNQLKVEQTYSTTFTTK